jgi:hypothetical protein
VARFVLHEAAEAVVLEAGSSGALLPDADVALPVLQLSNTGAVHAGRGAASAVDACGLLSGAVSELDAAQRAAIPAAVAWVLAHGSGLPLLNVTRS